MSTDDSDFWEPDYTNYYCSPEWHLARLVSTPFAALLYPFARRISKGTGRFHGSFVGISKYFGVSRWKVQRAVEALVDLGFFAVISKEQFRPSVYEVLPHNEWAKAHPGSCAVRETFPWSGENGDELGKQLWNCSGGKIKYMAYQLTALRRTQLTDHEIVEAFQQFIDAENMRRQGAGGRGHWQSIPFRFLQWLRGEVPESKLTALGLQPFRRVGAVALGNTGEKYAAIGEPVLLGNDGV